MTEKRPISYSESHIYFNSKNLPLISASDLIINLEEPIKQEAAKQEPVLVVSWFEICTDYGLRFVGHVFLISIFESLFFFYFVSKDEDSGILATTDFYTNTLINSCSNLTEPEITIANYVLTKFVNSSTILAQGLNSALIRERLNFAGFVLSWKYTGVLGGLQALLLFVSYYNKFKIRWSHIIWENLALVTFLGIYEYLFFSTVIKTYQTESPQEISARFVRGLQQQCHLL